MLNHMEVVECTKCGVVFGLSKVLIGDPDDFGGDQYICPVCKTSNNRYHVRRIVTDDED